MMTREKIEQEILKLKHTLEWCGQMIDETGNEVYRDHMRMLRAKFLGELKAFNKVLNE